MSKKKKKLPNLFVAEKIAFETRIKGKLFRGRGYVRGLMDSGHVLVEIEGVTHFAVKVEKVRKLRSL